MRQQSKLSQGSTETETPEKKAKAAVNLSTPERITLQLDTSLHVVNEISTPETEADCFSESHELELDHVTSFLSNSLWYDGNKTKGKKIPVLNRMKSFVSGVILQPRAYKREITDNYGGKNLESEVDTSFSLDNVSIDCRDVDVQEKGQPLGVQADADATEDEEYATDPENIEIPYDHFVPMVAQDSEPKEAAVKVVSSETEASALRAKQSEAEASKLTQTNAEPTTEPTANKELEVRSLNVSLQIKALTGVTRRSRKKLNFQGASDDAVAAVVSYQGTSIDGDEHVIMGSLSLPLLFEETEKKNGQTKAKGYAAYKQKDAHESCSSKKEGPEQGLELDPDGLLLVTTALKPELMTLRVGLQKGPYESISLGVATVIIPWDYQVVDLDIPVTRNCADLAAKKKKLFTLRSSAYVQFPEDTMTKYKIDEGASLSIRLAVNPVKSNPDDQRNISGTGSKAKEEEENANSLFDCRIEKKETLSLGSKSEELREVKITVVEPVSLTTQSKEIAEAGNDQDIPTTLSVDTEASSVPFSFVLASKKSEEDHYSEISDSSSEGGSFVSSVHSGVTNATEKVVVKMKMLTCDPFSLWAEKDAEEKDDESDNESSLSGSSSSGSTLSTSVYEEGGFVVDVDVDEETVEAEHVYKLPG